MIPVVGAQVLLVDGRGCHLVHVVTDLDLTLEDGFKVAGQCWESVRFQNGLGVDARDRLILKTATPAIGRPDTPWSDLYLPRGWSRPNAVTRAIARKRVV